MQGDPVIPQLKVWCSRRDGRGGLKDCQQAGLSGARYHIDAQSLAPPVLVAIAQAGQIHARTTESHTPYIAYPM